MENRRFNRPSREVSLIFVTLSVISFRDGFSIPYSSYTSNPLATPAPLWDPSCSSSASALLIPFGMISDRMKRRKIMAHGIAFVSAAISLVIARTEMNALLLAACIWGIGNATHTPCINSILVDKIGPEEMEHAYTYQALLNSLFYGTSALIGWIPELLVSMGGRALFGLQAEHGLAYPDLGQPPSYALPR